MGAAKLSLHRLHWPHGFSSLGLSGLLAFVGWLAAGPVRAQAPADDHLVPPTSWPRLDDQDLRYYSRVRRLLLPGPATRALVQVVVLPSFTPEYSLTVERTGPTAYSLTYRLARRNIWQATGHPVPTSVKLLTPQGETMPPPARPPAADSVAVVTQQLPVSPQLAQALTDVLSVALAQTRYPVQQPVYLDGTRLLFGLQQDNAGYRGGETFDPAAPGTHMAALVALVASLRELAANPEHRNLGQSVLLTDLPQLLIQLATPSELPAPTPPPATRRP